MTFTSMDPRHSIAPRAIIRRPNAKKWHLWNDRHDSGGGTFCGQVIRYPERSTAYNAEQIACTDCLVAAIRTANR